MKFLASFVLLVVSAAAQNEPPAGFVPKPGIFPPAGAGEYYAGELVSIDHVNRRGAIRLDGTGEADRYQASPPHHFVLLPYATLRYQGATADLVHVPLGTHVHGTFVLPPEGETYIPVPKKEYAKWVPAQNHVLLLEDDVSFYTRRGQAWRIDKIEPDKNLLTATLTGPDLPDGIKGTKDFSIDPSTRIWKGNGFGAMTDIQAGQSVQLSFAWRPEWEFGDYHIADVWLDADSLARAADHQRQLHIRHTQHRWLPGQIEHVEHLPGAKGIITFTPFAGQDPSFYEQLRAEAAKKGAVRLAAAEPSLRTWWHYHDSKYGSIIELKEIPDPPPGHSGLQLRFNVNELIDGYRPTRIGRLHLNGFSTKMLPAEERMKRLEDRRIGTPATN